MNAKVSLHFLVRFKDPANTLELDTWIFYFFQLHQYRIVGLVHLGASVVK